MTKPKPHPELDPATYGFTEADMDRPVFIDNVLGREVATPREILATLRQTYCGPIGVEYMHIQDPAQKDWLQRRIEGKNWGSAFDAEAKKTILRQLTEAEGFEAFCPEEVRRHQALRPGGRRGHHSRAACHDRDRRARRRGGGGDRHAASRPAEHLGERGAQAVSPPCSASSAAPARSRTTCRAPAT